MRCRVIATSRLSDLKPIAAPILGGMVSSLIHVLIVTPVIFYWLRERELANAVPSYSDEQIIRSETNCSTDTWRYGVVTYSCADCNSGYILLVTGARTGKCGAEL